MKFYNREKELRILEELNKRRPSFVVITGKRRVGKTELIKKFIANKKALYFFVDPYKKISDLIAEFMENIKKDLNLPAYIKVSTVEDFLELLFTNSELKKYMLVIAFDEFQRFLKLQPSFIAQLQKYWDLYKDKTNIFLIISGSSVGMIKKIFIEEKAPLFKRADNFIVLHDFDFWEISKILDDLGIYDPIEKINIFSLFGGTIYYYTLLEKYSIKSFKDALEKLLLNDFAPLRNEVQDIFVEEFGRIHYTYFEIMYAIASGKVSRKEIADAVKIKESSLSPYLSDLSNIVNLVEWRVPVTEHPDKSKRGRYFLTNNFVRFWFRFIYSNRSMYEIGQYKRIENKILDEWNSFVGVVFEDLSREFIKRKYSINFSKIGAWWDRKGNEVDIVCLNDRSTKALFFEVKWSDLKYAKAVAILEKLKEKTKYLAMRFKNISFGLIARTIENKEKLRSKGFHIYDFNDIINIKQEE
ncbi:MAG: ATP-binding protein [Candidatus Asgardarchaeia archaeon]